MVMGEYNGLLVMRLVEMMDLVELKLWQELMLGMA